MVLITENGWPQCSRDECETVSVPGTNNVRLVVHAGDAATVLGAWAAWFHRNIRSIEPPDGHQNWWYWDPVHSVWNSNHLSGTAIDLCADELNQYRYDMPQDQVSKVQQGLSLFEANIYWGRDWGAGDQDEMHFQCGYDTWNNPRFAQFAQRLRDGYLSIFGPPDPLVFPLPLGYYYGPLEGPDNCISGDYETDSQAAKDGLGRWQEKLHLPVTKRWDEATAKAATELQHQRGWKPNPAFGYGGVYAAEWDAVMRDDWQLPKDWDAAKVEAPEIPLVKWGDYSQYQECCIDESYPYPVVCFRASIADASATTATRYGGIDTKFVDNMTRAKQLVAEGKLKKVIAYHFWVPNFDNWGTFKAAIDAVGGVFPELAFMVDVEDGGPKWDIRGDQSSGVNEFITKGQALFVNRQAASIYVNFNANPDLLPVASLPKGVKIIVPRYAGPDNPPVVPAGVSVFGHQYAENENTAPFGPTDINQSRMTLSAWLQAWGSNGGEAKPEVDQVSAAHPTTFTEEDRALLTEVRDLLKQYLATTNEEQPPPAGALTNGRPPRVGAAKASRPRKAPVKRSTGAAKATAKTAARTRPKSNAPK